MFIKKNNVLKCLFLLLFLKSSLANHSLAWAWFLWSKVLLWWIIFLIDWYHKPLKNTIDPSLFYRELFYGFSWKGLWKHQKKNIHFTINIPTYTDHKHFEVLWTFILYTHIVKICFVFEKTVITLIFFCICIKHSQH